MKFIILKVGKACSIPHILICIKHVLTLVSLRGVMHKIRNFACIFVFGILLVIKQLKAPEAWALPNMWGRV